MAEIERIRRDVPLVETALGMGVALKSDGLEWSALCPFHQERTPSFTVFYGKDHVQRFHCFGCGAKGDVIDFVARLKGVTPGEAIRILDGSPVAYANVLPVENRQKRDVYAGIVPLPTPTTLAPDRKIVLYNPKRERNANIVPSMVFLYRSLTGEPLGYVIRHDLPDGRKETPAVRWARLPDGRECWCRLPFGVPRPLYGLDRIGGYGQVIIVEGEKCADALFALRRKPVLSWPGGSNGVGHADWSPLAGKDVVIWPDADLEGVVAAKKIAAILKPIAGRVRVADVFSRGKS